MLNKLINKLFYNTNNTNIYIAEGYIIGIIIFILYLELNPKLGNIWYRINENKLYQFRPQNILQYFIKPFTNIIFWYPINWDINPYIFSTIITLFFTNIRNLYNYIY